MLDFEVWWFGENNVNFSESGRRLISTYVRGHFVHWSMTASAHTENHIIADH